jgi:hypothetical protein
MYAQNQRAQAAAKIQIGQNIPIPSRPPMSEPVPNHQATMKIPIANRRRLTLENEFFTVEIIFFS